MCPIHEDYKVPYASVHFDAQAKHWYAAYIKPVENVDWESFVKDLYARFSVLTGVSVLGEFNKLKQIGTVDDYFNKFEALRAQVVQEFDYLDESYFCMSFIGGLRPEIQSRVEQFKVGSLTKAIYIARREEVAIQKLLKGHKSMHTATPTSNYTQTSYKPTFTNPGPSYKTAKPTTTQPIPSKPPALPYTSSFQNGLLPTPPRPPLRFNQLSTEEHQRRLSQGLCFRCGAKFEPGHKSVCPMKSIAMIIAEDDESRSRDVSWGFSALVINDALCEQRLWDIKHRGLQNFYMQVEGETRVGVFAAQCIKAGEPLTYDYRI
ncbi:hypothetical protein RJ640_000911 [Escallonia rubra]|uniref:Ty3 transposon capsid-like protein domain-containing protein n=1 Tax=Escallonia rubra TaxID=112253 RepID=A0AA88S1N2_9ASTE|nr:hypothetical protein RJ640_000911 [Escallonia rubra]